MTDLDRHQTIGRELLGSDFDWTKASPDVQAVVLAWQRERAAQGKLLASIADNDTEPIPRGFFARVVRDIVATEKRGSARMAALEDRIAALEAEKAGKPRIKLRAVSGRDD